MSFNTKNYTEPGGEKTVIGGTLAFANGAKVDNLPAATTTKTGGVKAGGGLSIASDGTLSVAVATDENVGGVVVGDGLSVTEDGTVSVAAATKTVAGGVLAVDNLEDCAATDVAGINAFINTYLLARLRSAGILKD